MRNNEAITVPEGYFDDEVLVGLLGMKKRSSLAHFSTVTAERPCTKVRI